jgi:16S rRNA (guanine527-N7)-methyltransferase
VGGYFISMKGNATEEVNEIDNNLKILGGSIEEINTFVLPIESSNRMLIKIKKAIETNKKYPREFKEIKKKPL